MYQELFLLQEELFKVLANHKRLEIIRLLDNRELSVTQMVEMLGLSQSNLSQHLTLLRQAKVVIARRDGHTVFYKLGDPRISEACGLVGDMIQDTQTLNSVNHSSVLHGEDMYPIVKDVVCGMRISLSRAGDVTNYEGTDYYFCASGCRESFELIPDKYIKKEVVRG